MRPGGALGLTSRAWSDQSCRAVRVIGARRGAGEIQRETIYEEAGRLNHPGLEIPAGRAP